MPRPPLRRSRLTRSGEVCRRAWRGLMPRIRSGGKRSRASSRGSGFWRKWSGPIRVISPGYGAYSWKPSKSRSARGVRGLVAELITVKAGYEVALEVALGSALQFVVIEEDRQAQAAIAYLKRSGRGRATFLPLNLVRGNRAAFPGAGRDHGRMRCASGRRPAGI